jgi:glycosyltransferase involved in cell wall biosynthesis
LNPVRVLIVTPEYPPRASGGIGRYYAELAPALAAEGCDVHVVVAAPFSEDAPDGCLDGVQVHAVARRAIDARAAAMGPLSASGTYRRWLAAAWEAADRAADCGPVDVVEATDFGLMFVPFLLAGAGPPVLVQMHGSIGQIAEHEPPAPQLQLDHALAKLTEALLLGRAEALGTYGAPNGREWTDRLDRDVEVIPPPVAPRREPAVPSSGAIVAGRIQPWKGPDVLCRAIAQVDADVLPSIAWVGADTKTGPTGESLSAALTAAYPDIWGRRIVPRDHVAFEEAQRLLSTARIVVVPSDWDVFNLTAAEAMSAGRVVICSDGAGAADLIEHGVNGFTFRRGDAEGLAATLAAAARLDDEGARRIGAAARATAATRLQPAAIARRRLETFDRLRRAAVARPEVAPWIRDFFSGASGTAAGPEFLDQMSVRDLSKYLGRRVGGKLFGRAASTVSR